MVLLRKGCGFSRAGRLLSSGGHGLPVVGQGTVLQLAVCSPLSELSEESSSSSNAMSIRAHIEPCRGPIVDIHPSSHYPRPMHFQATLVESPVKGPIFKLPTSAIAIYYEVQLLITAPSLVVYVCMRTVLYCTVLYCRCSALYGVECSVE